MEMLDEFKSYNFALLTLKERCHFLKEQLKEVDEENVKLKIQLSKFTGEEPIPTVQQNPLVADRLENLNKQKSQLSYQVNILATENSNLWLRLSKLSMLNRVLFRRLTVMSEILTKNGISTEFNDEEFLGAAALDGSECSKRTDDESLLLKKTDVDLSHSKGGLNVFLAGEFNLAVEMGFTSLEDDDDNGLSRLRKHHQKMSSIKVKLINQQKKLLTFLKDLKLVDGKKYSSENNKIATRDFSSQTDLNVFSTPSSTNRTAVEVNANEIDISNNDRDQVCPLCGTHIAGTMELFCDHVSSHIVDEPSVTEF